MIYIFQGCQGICSLPGYLCSACGDACKQCPGVCQFFSDACKGCGDEVKHFMERPLSVYVFLSMGLSAIALLSVAMDQSSFEHCTSTFLTIIQVFAVIHVAFAVYMQCTVWRTITSPENRKLFIDGDQPAVTFAGVAGSAATGLMQRMATGRVSAGGMMAQGARPAASEHFAPNPGKVIIPTQVIQESFRSVFMEDLVVLGMFFLLLIVFVMSWYPGLVDGRSCAIARGARDCGCTVSEMTRNCGTGFFWLGAIWAFMYMKCSCCANKVSITKEEMLNLEQGFQSVPYNAVQGTPA